MNADLGDVLDLIEQAVHSYEGPVHPDVMAAYDTWLAQEQVRYRRRHAEDIAYDMDPKPQPGQLVEITYRATWGCWDSIKRPITKPILQPDTSRFLAPRDAFVEIITEER